MALDTKLTWALLLGLSMAAVACDDSTDDTGDKVVTDDGGDSDGGATDDGGTSDGGDTDGGASDCDTGFGVVGYYGGATVTDGTAYENGWEDFYFIDLGTGADICRIASYVSDEGARDDCDVCDWAFDLKSYDSFYQNDTEAGCSMYGLEPSAFDDAEWSYGFASTWSYEYYGYTYTYENVLMFTAPGYESWYFVYYADWDGETFSYDWPVGYYYTYSEDCF